MASLHFLSASRYSMIPSCWLEHRQGQGQGGRLLLSHHQMNNICRRPRKPSCPAAAPVPVTNGPPPTTGLLITAAAAAVVISVVMGANAVEIRRTTAAAAEETLSNIPQMLSGDQECLPEQQQQQQQQEDCKNKKKKARIQKPKSRKAESCTIKCVTTCIRGGDGSPGEGPLNVRRPLVIFKQGFRSRQYCLMECSDICNLIRDGDDGP